MTLRLESRLLDSDLLIGRYEHYDYPLLQYAGVIRFTDVFRSKVTERWCAQFQLPLRGTFPKTTTDETAQTPTEGTKRDEPGTQTVLPLSPEICSPRSLTA